MLGTLLLVASTQLALSPAGPQPCEARDGVEIYVLEDMVDGPQIEAPFRVVEVIRGRDVEILELKQTVYDTGFLREPDELSKGTLRIAYVKDGGILRHRGCFWRARGGRSPDGLRFPGEDGIHEWRDDAFDLTRRFARAHVRFEREPTAELLVEMLTSDDLPVVRAGMWLLGRVVAANPPEALELLGQAIVNEILDQLSSTEERRIYLLENPTAIMRLQSRVFRWRREGVELPSWVEGLTEIYLRLEREEGPKAYHSGFVCDRLREMGVVERCDGSSDGLLPADRQRLIKRYDIAPLGEARREVRREVPPE